MKFLDKIKYTIAKMLFQETILFSKKDEWEHAIRKQLNKPFLFFYELYEVDLNKFDIVIPLSLHAQKDANNHYYKTASKKGLFPSSYSMDICDDKVAFVQHMEKKGFSEIVPKINKNLQIPYILKSKTGHWGEDIYIIKNKEDELARANEVNSQEYFKQEFIEGKEEYTAHVIIKDNAIVFMKALKFVFEEEHFVKGKYFQPMYEIEVNHSHFKKVFEDILISTGYQGICCFNYKLVGEDIKIFEVNPRYGGSMSLFINEALPHYRNAVMA